LPVLARGTEFSIDKGGSTMSVSGNLEEPKTPPHLRVELYGKNRVSHTVELHRGERVLWVNILNKECTVCFEVKCPFSNQEKKYTIASRGYTLSPPFDGPQDEYPYKVECGDDDGDDDDDDHKGDPVIVIKG
jgi:hypothetical protein